MAYGRIGGLAADLPPDFEARCEKLLESIPKLIDDVWQDTIDLAEVHVRGSEICNELRRSTAQTGGN